MLLLWTALFGGGAIGLEGRGASLEASPLALGLPSLGVGGRPGRQARRHLELGLPGLRCWGRPRAHVALWLPRPQAGHPSVVWRLISFL